MSEHLDIGTPPIPVIVKRSARARRFSLRISNKTGAISLTVPRFAAMKEAVKFAQEQEGWMRKHLASQIQPEQVALGRRILFDGQYCSIVTGQGRTARFEDGQLFVPGVEAKVGAKLAAYFKTLARERLVGASKHYAGLLGEDIGRVTLRDTRSRWGSCTSDGNLMYSWRLIMAPRSVQNYVAAHEVCHLIEMNHSVAYWDLVESIFPEYKTHRGWLKKNGTLLHRFEF